MLGENTWAIFIGTPQLQNYFYELHKFAEKTEGWYTVVLPANKTGVVPQDELDQAGEIMGE